MNLYSHEFRISKYNLKLFLTYFFYLITKNIYVIIKIYEIMKN